MNGVQSRIRTLHLKQRISRHEKNVGLVAAMVLVEKAPRFGNVHGFALGHISQEDDGIGDAALRTHNEAVQVDPLVRIGIANLWILGDRERERMGLWTRPLHRPTDLSWVGNGHYLVVALSW